MFSVVKVILHGQEDLRNDVGSKFIKKLYWRGKLIGLIIIIMGDLLQGFRYDMTDEILGEDKEEEVGWEGRG